jgi:thioredoxin reductase (NADPH)
MDTNITVYGAYWCPDCRQSKRFLSEHQIAYEWVDIEQDELAQLYVEKLNDGKRIIPTITFGDGSFLVEPSNAELAKKLGLATKDPHDFHEVTIIGAGPAGLTSAIYNARDGFSVMVVDEGALGGQATTTENLDNYPGFPDGISGSEWSQRVVEQAKRFGVEFLRAQTVVWWVCARSIMGSGSRPAMGTSTAVVRSSSPPGPTIAAWALRVRKIILGLAYTFAPPAMALSIRTEM